jgi:hypothetical protein
VSSELHASASIDEQRVRKGCTELVAAIAAGSANVGDAVDEKLMTVDLRVVISGEDGRAAGVIRVGVGVDDRAYGRGGEFRELAFTAPASVTSLVVSTMIDQPSPWIRIEFASEKPTAT